MAARRKATFRIRSWAAILAALVCFVSMLILSFISGRRSIGQPLFVHLTTYGFGLCILAGVFLTSDCLSEEKREGTLGLLFLTDLHGYDVVAGKLIATSLSALYCLLTLLPITAFPLLLGGVTGGEFWRTAFALLNALFVSLTAGIWVSSLVRDGQQAMIRAFILILVLTVGLPVLGDSLPVAGPFRNFSIVDYISPYTPFSSASASVYFSHAQRFRGSLAASHLLGWVFICLAAYLLPSRWQDKTVQRKPLNWFARFMPQRRANLASREKARHDLLPINPVLWLVSGEQGFGQAAWLIVMAWACVIVIVMGVNDELGGYTLSAYISKPFAFFLKLLFATQVCRFFIEARRNGALEMLLCTPLTNREIIKGQALAIKKSFFWPILIFVVLLFVPFFHHIIKGVTSFDFGKLFQGGLGFGLSGITAARTVADFFALFWFGLWLALTMKKPAFAPAMTVLAVLILPSILCWLDIFADLFFILLGATKLQQDFRWILAKQFQTPIMASSPPMKKGL